MGNKASAAHTMMLNSRETPPVVTHVCQQATASLIPHTVSLVRNFLTHLIWRSEFLQLPSAIPADLFNRAVKCADACVCKISWNRKFQHHDAKMIITFQ